MRLIFPAPPLTSRAITIRSSSPPKEVGYKETACPGWKLSKVPKLSAKDIINIENPLS